MIFLDRFRRIWSKRKYKLTPTEIESLRQDLRQSRARLAIRQMPEYPILKEWLEDMIFAYYEKLNVLNPAGALLNITSAETVDFILSKFESSTPEQIGIDEKNLKTLQEK